jgi:drug/metabolite transporter (DMT)-like permease
VSTSAGKGGFITGLYVIVVPVLGAMEGRRTGWGTWLGAVLAVGGLSLLSLNSQLRLSHGDLLVLAGALLWAMHVLIIGRLMEHFDALLIAFQQFALVALLSLGSALVAERGQHQALMEAALPLLYAGVLSTGVAFTLQVMAQRQAPPGHAAVLLSLEAVFAALGGWLLLGERLGARGLAGCALMLAGMLSTQLLGRPRRARERGGSADPPLVRPTP